MFAYSFKDMYDWYVDNIDNKELFEENKTLAVYEITATKKYEALSEKKQRALKIQPLKKNEGYLGMFKKQNVTGIIKFKSIGTDMPNGLYCVIDDSNIYAVFPELKNGHMLADHLTFMSDNVHLTTYQPEPLDPNRGFFWHVPKCKLIKGTKLPLTGYECSLLNPMGHFKNMILDIARTYKTYSGGTKSLSVSKPTKRSPQRVTQSDISGTLEVLLIKYNIKTVKIFCVRKENSWDILVMNDGDAESLRFNIVGLRWPSIQKRIIELYMELI